MYDNINYHYSDAASYLIYTLMKEKIEKEKSKPLILPNRDYKSIECLRYHGMFKKAPTKRLEQCFDVQDAQIVE